MFEEQIEAIARRTYRYWVVDGLSELGVGVVFLLVGGYFYLSAVAPAGSLLATSSALGLPVIVIVAGLSLRWLVKIMKRTIIFPRTGYVSYHSPARATRWLRTAGAAFLAATIVIGVRALVPGAIAWMALLNGLVIGLALIYLGHKFGVLRFHVIGGLSIIVAAIISAAALGDMMSGAAYFGFLGLCLALSGGLTLGRYFLTTAATDESLPEGPNEADG